MLCFSDCWLRWHTVVFLAFSVPYFHSLFLSLSGWNMWSKLKLSGFPFSWPLSTSKTQVEGNKCKSALKEPETNATGSEEMGINRSQHVSGHTHTLLKYSNSTMWNCFFLGSIKTPLQHKHSERPYIKYFQTSRRGTINLKWLTILIIVKDAISSTPGGSL